MSYATNLTEQEMAFARSRLAELAMTFHHDGTLVSPQWRDVFLRTWRHPYVPAYYPALDRPPVLCIGEEAQRSAWLEAVYSNQTLVTKVVQLPMSRAFQPATSPMYTSSSTLPSLVLRMLETLDVETGHRVLEIGTGTGYNCALLCERVGSDRVTSVDIDPELIDLARERLAANGHTPTLEAVDGAEGYPQGAPYDRIISTCAVPSIPSPWLKQVTPGAVILTDVRRQLGGTLARLTVNAEGVATGRFVPYSAGFMWMRRTVEPSTSRLPRYDHEPARSTTDVDPALLLEDGLFGFVAQWFLPDASRGIGTQNGRPTLSLMTPDGSYAELATSRDDGGFEVTQGGPRRLWDRVVEAHAFWEKAGRPSYERFGLTATPSEQHVWFDNPDSDHRWPLSQNAT
ncbi:MAG: methyltransferase domain-containing protein [Pseudonocardiaceae bacterium]